MVPILIGTDIATCGSEQCQSSEVAVKARPITSYIVDISCSTYVQTISSLVFVALTALGIPFFISCSGQKL